MWRLYHATRDGRLFNYPVHLSSWHGSTAALRHRARHIQCAQASTGRVRYLHVSEEVGQGTILRPWSGEDHPVGEKRVSLAGQPSVTTTATMGRSSTSGWHLIHTM